MQRPCFISLGLGPVSCNIESSTCLRAGNWSNVALCTFLASESRKRHMHSISVDIPLIKSAERFQLSPFNITVIILTQNRRGRRMLCTVPQYRAPRIRGLGVVGGHGDES